MASFQAFRLEKSEKERKEKLSFRSVPTRCIGKFQKNSRKIKNIKKNTIIASFQSKIGWKRLRKTKSKNYRSVSFLPDA